MARRTTGLPRSDGQRSLEELTLILARLEKRIEEVRSFAPGRIHKTKLKGMALKLHASIDDVLTQAFGHETPAYRRYQPAAEFDQPFLTEHFEPFEQIVFRVARVRDTSLALLEDAHRAVKERLEEISIPVLNFNFVDASPEAANRKVFIVHGHDVGVREAVARFLERAEFIPIVLHEQANQGRTIIEKFESNADVGFAVVLLTPDDLGAPAKDRDEWSYRARQNVILELGFFIGRLGRDRVCALRVGDLELPTDILGVVWTPFDQQGAWQVALAKELEAADYKIDWNKIMGRRG